MNLEKDKYIIVEIIPTSLKKENGQVVELTALKVDGLKLIDRFNYRLNKDNVSIKEFTDMCSYDDDKFTYLDQSSDILNEFKNWVEDLPIFIIDNTYTLNYFDDLDNKLELVFPYLDLDFNGNVIQEMIDKYKLEASNYMVDLVYEAIIRHF